MKKTIAIMLPAMRMGGAEKVCLNFINDIIPYYDIKLVLNRIEGDLLLQLPEKIEIIEDRLYSFHEILSADIRKFRLNFIIKDLLYYIKVKLRRDNERNYRYLVDRTPVIPMKFDYAINYVANVSTQIFCLCDRIDAYKKIAWIHGETSELADTALFEECYRKFDKIYAVSGVTAEHFVKRFPSCKKITDVYYNRIECDKILSNAELPADIVFEQSVLNIVTVGRLTPEKGCAMIPEIVSILINSDLNIHWYIIGDGTEFEHIRQLIVSSNTEKFISLLGTQINPHPYVKQCDIYVQPSYEEGYSTTICEAGTLGKAIIGTTTSGGIREQLQDGISGLLADPTPQSIANKIKYLATNPDVKATIEKNVLSIDFSNQNEINKLLSFLPQ